MKQATSEDYPFLNEKVQEFLNFKISTFNGST